MSATLIKKASQAITAQDQSATVDGLPSPAYFAVQVTGTLSATITFEATADGNAWAAIELSPSTDLSDTGLASSTTAAGLWVTREPLAVAGLRARCSAFTSATGLVATVRASCI